MMRHIVCVTVCCVAVLIYYAAGHHNSYGSRYGGQLGGYGSLFSSYSYTNRSVLCALKGGTCVTTTTSCVGVLKFQCENLALCCFNTTSTFFIKTVVLRSYGPRSRSRSRGYGQRRSYGRRWKK